MSPFENFRKGLRVHLVSGVATTGRRSSSASTSSSSSSSPGIIIVIINIINITTTKIIVITDHHYRHHHHRHGSHHQHHRRHHHHYHHHHHHPPSGRLTWVILSEPLLDGVAPPVQLIRWLLSGRFYSQGDPLEALRCSCSAMHHRSRWR